VNCSQTQNLLHAYLDGELDLVRHLEIEHHLADCRACTEAHESQLALRTALGSAGLYQRAPAELKERLHGLLGKESQTPPVPSPAPRTDRSGRRWLSLTALAASVAVLLLGLGVLGSTLWRSQLPTDDQLVGEVVSSHVRSTLAEHLTDVASEDTHTVKPWFKGKVDFAPTVLNLKKQDFPLLGGRLDYVNNRPVAALVYKRREHVINLFIWPGAPGQSWEMRGLQRQGYHLLHWVQSGMNYWAISDLNPEELHQFSQLLQASSAPSPM
jgi:anti-sigma factor RsiW